MSNRDLVWTVIQSLGWIAAGCAMIALTERWWIDVIGGFMIGIEAHVMWAATLSWAYGDSDD